MGSSAHERPPPSETGRQYVWEAVWVPEYTPSREATWLGAAWTGLAREFSEQWIAVVGEGVYDADTDPVALVNRVGDAGVDALFAFVSTRPRI